MIAQLTAADFEPLVGQPLAVVAPGGAELPGELVAVRLLPDTPGRPNPRPPFALVVRARTPHHLPQGLFAVILGQLGRLDVFLVPVGRYADGLLLEAVFN